MIPATHRDDERGATLALVALCTAALVGVVALVVDVGSGRLTRQNLVPATDAAALAAAQELVDHPWDTAGACAAAESFLAGNAPAAAMTSCDIESVGPGGGRVAIGAAQSFDTYFADRAGGAGGAGTTASVSAAAWGPPLTVTGLRPLALCYDGSVELRRLIDEPPSHPSMVTIGFLRTEPGACGGLGITGNFLSVDFDGGARSHEIRDWMRDGFPEQVALDGQPASSCDGDIVCYRRPYAILDIVWQLASLRDSRDYVSFPIYDYADADQVHLIGVVRARLLDFDLRDLPASWSLELKIDPGLIGGACCGLAGIDGGNKAIALCGVDPGAYLACDPETGS